MNDSPLSGLTPSATGVPTAHQHVREVIRQLILSGELPAGSRLRQVELASMTGASTTPVREALRDLAAERLVTLDAHRGAEVRSIDPEEVSEIYDLRILLEPHAVARAASRITPAELDRATDIVARMTAIDDPAEWALLNRDFHALIVDAGGSERLSLMVKGLRDSAVLFVGTVARHDHSRMRTGDDDHAAIVDALRSGDSRLAGDLTRRHLQGSLRISGIDADGQTFGGEQ
jgi:DNA-binding GntR family transcriptional regulator